MTTAEWTCTNCKSINRRLVPAGVTRVADRCLSCHRRHILEPGDRPVRWRATEKSS